MGDAPDDTQPEKGYKNHRLTAAEKSGRARADMGSWRKKVQASKIKFDDVQKGIYVNVLGKTGRRQQAADAAGVCYQTVMVHRENDPEFEAAVQHALGRYADTIHKLATKLMEGVKKPIVGGKFKDEIVAHELVHATNLLAMEMRRTNAEYKERSEIDLKHGGSVLIAPADMSPEEWIKQQEAKNADRKEPGADEGQK